MDRRSFLKSTGAVVAASGLPYARASNESGWRLFEVTNRVELSLPEGQSRVWLPLPLTLDNDWHKTFDTSWRGNASRAEIARDGKYGIAMLHAEWPARETSPTIEVTSRFATR